MRVRRKSNGELMEVIGTVDEEYAAKNNSAVGLKICRWGKPGHGFRSRPFRDDEIEAVDG